MMDDDVDIYGDLPSFDANECGKFQCKERAKELTSKNVKLEEEGLFWKLKCETLDEEKKTIITNTSSLMKTARAEITRKDKIIMELRQELEDLKFKRGIWRRPGIKYPKPGHPKKQPEIKRNDEEFPVARIKTTPVDDEPALTNMSDEDEEEPEKKWDFNKQNCTLYGERLRRKILLEQEAERIQREEAKFFVSTVPETSIKVEQEEDKESQGVSYIVRSDYAIGEISDDLNEEAAPSKYKAVEFDGLKYSGGDYKSRGTVDTRCDATRDERVAYKDDFHRQNANFHRDSLYNFSRNSRYEDPPRLPRDTFGRSDHVRNTRKREDFQQTRGNHEKRDKSNYRSLSKTPDRGFNERRYNRHRGEKYRDHSERHEKKRDDGPTRDRYNCTEYNRRDIYDLRGKLERKIDDKFCARNDHDNYRNYDSDHKRRVKSRSPGVKYRSRSSGHGVRDSEKRRTERSRSREHLVDGKVRRESSKERESKRGGSRDRKLPERDNGDSEILEPKTSEFSTRDSTKDLTSNVPLPGEPKVPVADVKTSRIRETRDKSSDEIEAATETLAGLMNQIEARDKFISMLENDSEIPLSPLIRPAFESIGSSSFREEKIENIEKFIQNYRYDESNCGLLGYGETEESSDEKKFANSTNSIVDTLSMDIGDVVPDKELGDEIFENPGYSLSEIVGDVVMADRSTIEVGVDRELEEDAVDEKFENVAITGKMKNFGTDEKSGDVSVDKNLDDAAIYKKLEDAASDKKSVDFAINEKLEDDAIDKKTKDATIENKLEVPIDDVTTKDVAIDKKLEEEEEEEDAAIDHKSEDVALDRKSEDAAIDHKSEDVSNDGKPKNGAINDESENITVDKKPEVAVVDEKPRVLAIEEKMENIGGDVKSRKATIDRKSEDVTPREKSLNVAIDEKSENVVADNKSANISIEKKVEDVGGDVKSRDATTDRKTASISLDGKSRNLTVNERSENVAIDKKLENAATTEKPENTTIMVSPPLPPSPELPPLPPLPPSPPPEEKEPETSVTQSISTIKPDTEKPQTEKALAKQSKKRPRIPCLPIVSLYSRRRRVLVLTDSVASHTIVRSEFSKDTTGDGAREKLKNQQNPKIEQKTTSHPAKVDNPPKSPVLKEIQSENSASESIISKTKKKTASEDLLKASDTSDSKSTEPIRPKTGNAVAESVKPEERSSSKVETSGGDTKSENESPTVSKSSKKSVIQRKLGELENGVEESQPEVESKKASKLKNPDKNSTTRASRSSKSSERETRSAVKTTASTVPTSDPISSSRKRPLSREKENQSKPAKQVKMMIVVKRRPITLVDSSIATTLVSSEHEVSSKDNGLKIPPKVDVPGRKRRGADK